MLTPRTTSLAMILLEKLGEKSEEEQVPVFNSFKNIALNKLLFVIEHN